MRSVHRFAFHGIAALALASLIAPLAACGSGDATGSESDDLMGFDALARLKDKFAKKFTGEVESSLKGFAVPALQPFTAPTDVSDPGSENLHTTIGVAKLDPDEDTDELDGALAGAYTPSSGGDRSCFFMQSPNLQPTAETLFWAEYYGFRAKSGKVSDISGKPISKEVVGGKNVGGGETRTIFYVNGVNEPWTRHCAALETIANLTGAVTVGVLNESEGIAKDIWQTGWDRISAAVEVSLGNFGIKMISGIHQNAAATTMTNIIVQRVRQKKHTEIWAHSQGGALTSLALSRALNLLEQEGSWPIVVNGKAATDMIKVVSLGSAAPAWPAGAPTGPIYEHFIHVRDATPSILGVGPFGGTSSSRAGDGAVIRLFDGDPTIGDFHNVDDTDDINFIDLRPVEFHRTTISYLPAYAKLHSNWSK